MNRREFIKKAGLLWMGIVVAPMAIAKVLAESKSATVYEIVEELLERGRFAIDYGTINPPLSCFTATGLDTIPVNPNRVEYYYEDGRVLKEDWWRAIARAAPSHLEYL